MSQVIIPKAIPARYKQSEAGVIPVDWKALKLDDVCSFIGGAQPEKSTFSYKLKSGYIRLIQIRDYKSDKYIVYIPEKLARKKCDENDIMIGRYGPPIFQILRGIEGAYNVALIKTIPNNVINRDFLYYFIKNDKLFELMDMLSQRSSGQTGVELPALKAYPIALPPKEEQTAIANALSDMDALLSELEKLIAKKQAIKTATMQQLLTGKIRLPAFSLHTEAALKGQPKGTKPSELGEIPEDWEIVPLSDICTFGGGTTPPRAQHDRYFVNGSNNWVKTTDLNNSLIRISEELITDLAISETGLKKYPVGTILVAMYGGFNQIGRTGYITRPSTINQALVAIKPKPKKLNSYYLLSELNYNVDYWKGVASSSRKDPNITSKDIKNYVIALPLIEEQTAIATILSDMDAEIQALKQHLAKTKQIKQGMMQELLTGKTRLPFDKKIRNTDV
ncbi:MAG: hypothetical protein COA47_17905 [Robiginitomaculum sp.]|nr:MAG: hypothetical protein COA47_17905 [Robiginitomaculum sp.]